MAGDSERAASVFVIGGTGEVGRELLALLAPAVNTGELRLLAGVRSEQSARVVSDLGAEAVQFNLDDRLNTPATHVMALRGVDTVFLLTGYSVDMLAESKAVIDSAVEAGVKHIVHLGLMALPDTRGIHQGWHQLIEAYIERSGLRWTHLHPNMFMTALPAMQLQNDVFPIPDSGPVVLKGYIYSHVKCSWIAPFDISRAAATVLRDPTQHDRKSYKLAVDSLTFNDLAELASEVLGREFHYQAVGLDGLQRWLVEAGMEAKYAESAVHTQRLVNAGLLPDFGDVHDDFRQLTGTSPLTWREAIALNPGWFGMS